MSGPCPGCGAPTAPRSTWCSQACNAKSRKKRYPRACIACGCEFEPPSSERDTAKYCSNKCRREHERTNSKNYPKRGKRALHRIVMSETLGRPLSRTEIVHHKNRDKSDFSAGNLELKGSQSEHMREHWSEGSLRSTHEDAVARGRRSGEVRRAKMVDRSSAVAAMSEAGSTAEEIAASLGISLARVRKLRKARPHCLPLEDAPRQRSLFGGVA